MCKGRPCRGRAHQQKRVLGHQPGCMAASCSNLLPKLCMLLCTKAGVVGQQELLPAAQCAPPLIVSVVIQWLGCACGQQPPLLLQPEAGDDGIV